mmetsp:Transcript_108867/g.303552  ORF Transcript_108867/g.303552 Transcript_108867/m.303552 type:complete len:233 (-) Transcript_108867:2-700(-)
MQVSTQVFFEFVRITHRSLRDVASVRYSNRASRHACMASSFSGGTGSSPNLLRPHRSKTSVVGNRVSSQSRRTIVCAGSANLPSDDSVPSGLAPGSGADTLAPTSSPKVLGRLMTPSVAPPNSKLAGQLFILGIGRLATLEAAEAAECRVWIESQCICFSSPESAESSASDQTEHFGDMDGSVTSACTSSGATLPSSLSTHCAHKGKYWLKKCMGAVAAGPKRPAAGALEPS